MNAAILLVTTAWFAGADPVPTTTAPRTGTAGGAISSGTAPVMSGMGYGSGGYGGMGYGGGCGSGGCGGSGCGECCVSDCCCSKPGLCARLRARRNSCCNTCCECGCNSGCGSNVSSCGSSYGAGSGCGCQTCCETCCSKPGLCARLRARRHQNSCCECGCGCESCGGCGGMSGGMSGGIIGGTGIGGTTVPGYMPGAEKINPPKDTTPGNKMPTGKGAGTVQSQGLGLTPANSIATPSF